MKVLNVAQSKKIPEVDAEIDIESDESFSDAGTGEYESDNDLPDSTSTQSMTPTQKKAHHNALERKRRDMIKDSFQKLANIVPNCTKDHNLGKGSNSSRAVVLQKATAYIGEMNNRNDNMKNDIDKLKRELIQLAKLAKEKNIATMDDLELLKESSVVDVTGGSGMVSHASRSYKKNVKRLTR